MSSYKNSAPFFSARCEYQHARRTYALILPILLLSLGIFTRWVSGSPLPTLHYIEARSIVPAGWVMVLFFSIYYVAAGFALGVVLGNRFCAFGEKKYQGAMWFVISLALGYVWYPLFFCARLFLVSIIVSVLCLFTSICATICFANVSKLSFFIAIICDAWLIYLVLLNMQIFFGI